MFTYKCCELNKNKNTTKEQQSMMNNSEESFLIGMNILLMKIIF